jgi:pilus assembly protein CpaE
MSGVSVASRPGTESGSGDRPQLVAFVTDEVSESALRGGLGPLVEDLQIRRGNVTQAIRAMEREPTPRVLIVDVSGIAEPPEALDQLAQVCEPDVRVLVVGDREDVAFYRRLTHGMGVAEYLYKPLTRDHVARLFGPALAGAVAEREEGTGRGGRVVAVCGARGGSGASTVAANLALAVSATSRGHVALVDLHLRGGTIALQLGARSGSGLRIALENPEKADALFLERAAIPVADRVRLIAAEEPMETDPQATPESVKRFLELLRHRFNTIVVDLTAPPGKVERAVLGMARQVVITFGPDVSGVRDALAMKRMVASQASGAHALLVLNRAGMPGGLSNELVQEGLGTRPDCVLPWLPKPMLKAFNLGQPAIQACPPFKRAMEPLVREVSGVAATRAGTGGKSSLLGLLGIGERR